LYKSKISSPFTFVNPASGFTSFLIHFSPGNTAPHQEIMSYNLAATFHNSRPSPPSTKPLPTHKFPEKASLTLYNHEQLIHFDVSWKICFLPCAS